VSRGARRWGVLHCPDVRPAGSRVGPLEVVVEELRGLVLVAGHQVPLAVERDPDVGVAHVGAEGLCVDARSDHQRGEGVTTLVQRDRRELRGIPRRARASSAAFP